MALPVNKIGIHYFMSLDGNLEIPRGMLEVDQRLGVDGSEILHTRSRGVPFTLRSIVDVASYANGQFIYREYQNVHLASNNPAGPIIQSDYDTSAGGWYAKVLAIRLIKIQKAAVIVGGLNYTSGAILECEWTLIGISI